MNVNDLRRLMERGTSEIHDGIMAAMASSGDGGGDEGGDGDNDGTPDQPEKYLHCRWSGYIAQVEAPDPVESHGRDEGPSFC